MENLGPDLDLSSNWLVCASSSAGHSGGYKKSVWPGPKLCSPIEEI